MERSRSASSSLQFFCSTAAAIVLLGALALWHRGSPVSLHVYLEEDGLFENATAVFYGLSFLVFLVLSQRRTLFSQENRGLRCSFMMLWAFGTFMLMGEEISWGQRIFGFETPEAIERTNLQGEFNLHNLPFFKFVLDGRLHLFSLLMVTVGIVFPLLVLTPWGPKTIQRFAFPVIPSNYIVLFLGALLYGKYLRPWGVATTDATEIRECLWSLGIFLFALHGLTRPWDLFRLPQASTDSR